jgi:hypothetical protein
MVKNKKKIVLYTGNHDFEPAIADYIESLESMISSSGHYFFRSKSLRKLLIKKYDILILIEEFSRLDKLLTGKLLVNKFKEKIIILTEFINKEKKTFNFFNDTLSNKYLFYTRLKEIIYSIILKLNFFQIFFIFFFLKKITIIFLFYLYKILFFILLYFFTLIIFIYRRELYSSFLSSKKFLKNKLLYKRNIFLNETKYMKNRYLGFRLLINNFNKIMISHDKILINSNSGLVVKRIYFNLKNKEINFDNQKKSILTFSGTINPYRIGVLKNIYQYKNPLFDYSEIEKIINSNNLGFRVSKPVLNCNVFSIHIKKAKYWLYSSPARYINSLNKNEIPVILDEFDDLEAKILTLKKNVFNIKNLNDFYEEIKMLNSGIVYYKKFVNEYNKSLTKILF